MEKPLVLPAQMQSPTWQKDDSVAIRFISSLELSDDQFLHLSKYRKITGWLQFVPNQADLIEIEDGEAPMKYGSKRSQRIRLKLFKLHLQRGGSKETANAMYEKWMDKIEGQIDELLD